MKYYLVVNLLILSVFIFAQEKTRRIPFTTKEGVKALVEIDNVNKKIKPKTEYTYFWFKSKTILSTQGAYQGHLLHGLYQENYSSKQLKIQGYYKYGLKNGTWSYWDEQGKLTEQENWKKGVLQISKVKTAKIKKSKEEKKTKEEKKPEEKVKIKKTKKEKSEIKKESKQPSNE